MKHLKLIIIALVTLTAGICLASCGGDDDEENSLLQDISITELESTPSFSYEYTSSVGAKYSYTKYVWFRNGRMYYFKKGYTTSRSEYTSYTYNISGKVFTLTDSNGISYTGVICKNTKENKLIIAQSMDGTGPCTLPEDVLEWYSYCSAKPD